MNTSKNLNYLRALATFMVVLLHSVAPHLDNLGSLIWDEANFIDSGVRSSVPLFFMVSGVFLLNQESNLKEFYFRRLKRILLPFLFWSIIYVFYEFGFETNFDGLLKFLRLSATKITIGSYYHLWFMYAIMSIYIIIPIMRKFFQNANRKEIEIFLIIWFFMNQLKIHFNIYAFDLLVTKFDLIIGYFGYCVLGLYLNKYKLINRKNSVIIFLSGFILTFFLSKLVNLNAVTFNGVFYKYLSFNNVFMAIGVFSFFNYLNLENSSAKAKILLEIDKYGLGIYFVHVLILNFINLNWEVNVITFPIITLVRALLTLVFSYLIIRVFSGFQILSRFIN